MPDVFPVDINTLQAFLLVLTRVTAALAFIPVTGGMAAPKQVRAALSIFVAIVVFPVVDISHISVNVDVLSIGLTIIGEFMIGALTALFVGLVFAGVQLAGAVIGFQVGFGIVNVVDPVTSAQISITSQFMNLVSMLLFLALNIHLVLIGTIANSFNIIPLGGFASHQGLLETMVRAMGAVFITGAQLAAPLTVMLLLKQVAMGLIARSVPQMNIFVVGFPVTIALGLFSMGIAMPAFGIYITKLFSRMTSQIELAFHLMG